MLGLSTLSLQPWQIKHTTGLTQMLGIPQRGEMNDKKDSLRLLMPLETLKKRGSGGLLSDYMRADAL